MKELYRFVSTSKHSGEFLISLISVEMIDSTKTAEPIELPLRVIHLGGPRNHVLDVRCDAACCQIWIRCC